MKVGLAIFSTPEIEDKTPIIIDLSDRLNSFFETRFYGNDLKDITFGLEFIPESFSQFFNKNKKYYKGDKEITHDGISIKVSNALEYSLLMPYEQVKKSEELQLVEIILNKVYGSLDEISMEK